MKRLISLCLVLLSFMLLASCGKKDRQLYADVKLSKYVKLGEYENIPVDKASDTFKELYNDLIEGDISNNDLYVRKTEGTVADGDTVNIDYEGKKDGVAFDGGTAKGQNLKIGSNSFIDGFEEGLIGVSVGKTVDLNLTFSENYGNEELNGKAVVFTVKVNYIKTDEPMKPEEYYKELDFKSYKAYNKDVTERAIKNYLLDTISANTKIKDYPEKELEYFKKLSIESTESQLSQYGMSLEDYLSSYMKQTMEEYEKTLIKEQVKPMMDIQLALYAILDEEGLEVTKGEVSDEINKQVKLANSPNVTAEKLKEYYGEYYFEVMVVRDKVIDLVYKKAKIS